MKVVIINKSDATGGAAVVSMRLLQGLCAAGVEAMMLVAEKKHDSPYVELAANSSLIKRAFLAERLKIFLANGMNRDTLFKIDTASDGLPLHRNRYVREADVICLNWVNQGLLSLGEIEKIAALGKPIVWTMHDMWNFTGICHHAGSCQRYKVNCGLCHLLGDKCTPTDLSFITWNQKNQLYNKLADKLHFVAVSHWLAEKGSDSSLMGERAAVTVIPNAFPVPDEMTPHKESDGKFRILMGAARLDDPVKGLPLLMASLQYIKDKYPDEASNMELVTFGNIKNPESMRDVPIRHQHKGEVRGEEALRTIYSECDAVVSSSLYETLPGTLVEGQVYGCIPVSFDRGGQRDIIDHERTGFLAVREDDAAKAGANLGEGLMWAYRIWSDKEALAQMRKDMYRSAKEKFDAAVIARKYIDLFDSILADKDK